MASTFYEDRVHLEQAVTDLLRASCREADTDPQPRMILLPGGGTPRGVYQLLTEDPLAPAQAVCFGLTDDRQVPDSEPVSNFFALRPALEAASVPPERIYRPDKALSPPAAADRYQAELAHFLAEGGRITLALLGLGTDGHTTALFTPDDLARARDRLVLASPSARPC